ncbi:SLOG cluster 4 domain-containing protein [Bradyrhizobium diazoefficiens]
MAREPLVAVIGGNDLPDIASSARTLGEELASRAILLTGGEPDGSSAHVKNAAMNGCRDAGGLMISVLPDGPRSCLVSGRRLILRTGLRSLERDPITGAAADVVVVLSGGRGTLVELAYAVSSRTPLVFMASLDDIKRAYLRNEGGLLNDLEAASRGYPLVNIRAPELMNRLKECLSDLNLRCAATVGQAGAQVSNLIGGIDCRGPTNFLGLPGQNDIKTQFEQGVLALSRLR